MNDETVYKKVHFDFWLLIITILLVAMGVTMVYSSSALLATEKWNDSYRFLKKEVLFVVVGFALLTVMLKIPYQHYKKLVYPVLGLSVLALLLTFIPGVGAKASGAARWIRLGSFTVQPSEFAKIAVILFLSYSLTKKAARIKTFTVGFLSNAIIVGIVTLLVLGGRDFGSAVLIAMIAGILFFVAGVRPVYLIASILASLPMLYVAIASVEYRRKRILSFLDPWADRYGSGFQMIQSFVAFSQGGVLGQGLGEGRQKLFYLPEAHTDFIASVLGEELGMIGVVTMILLFGLFAYRGVKIAFSAADSFGRYLAFGITLLISLQAIMNLLVVMGFFPTKGMVLPFISYGGSALLTMLVATGVLLNISSYRRAEESVEEVL
jgi:cell division protein FtsW